MVFVGTFLIWLGCFISYLSSNKQKLNRVSIGKVPAWSIFIACLLLAIYCFTFRYGVIVSVLNSLLMVMAMWLLLVIVSAHFNHKLILIGTLSFGLFSSILVLGVK